MLLTPTSPTVAFPIGDRVDDPLAMYACDLFTLPVNLAGMPGLSIPAASPRGCRSDCNCGPPFAENRLLAAGHALERAFAFDPVPPALEPPVSRGRDPQRPRGLGGGDRPRDPRAAGPATKMFCRCPNEYGGEPNTRICPVCTAQPGALPVPNRAAVEKTIMVGLAWARASPSARSSTARTTSIPTAPRRTRSASTTSPCASAGAGRADGRRRRVVRFVRAHLEEDAAKTIHEGGHGGRIAGSLGSVVDFNRCGTPLLEIVTEPDLRSPEAAVRFLTLLKATIEAIGVSDCDMEKGSLRCDANVSLRRPGETGLRPKVELKNMNSFRFLERGMAHELSGRRRSPRRRRGRDARCTTTPRATR